MIKTMLMLIGLTAFTGASVACFGLFSERRSGAAEQSCEKLSGPAKTECEQRKATPPR